MQKGRLKDRPSFVQKDRLKNHTSFDFSETGGKVLRPAAAACCPLWVGTAATTAAAVVHGMNRLKMNTTNNALA